MNLRTQGIVKSVARKRRAEPTAARRGYPPLGIEWYAVWEEAGKKEVDLQGRNSGTYYLRLIKGKQTEVIKLVIR